MEFFQGINLKTIIDIIVALSTVATLIVIWLTLREMKTERVTSYEPIILPLNFQIFSFCKFKNQVPRPYCSTNKENAIDSDASQFHLTLRNIGQGLAKNISITLLTNIDYAEYLNEVRKDLKSYGIDLDMRINENSCWVESDEKYGNFITGNFPYQINFTKNYDYLIPIHQQENEEIQIRLPRSFQLVVMLTVILLDLAETEEMEKYYNRFREYLNLKVNVIYEDNLNNSFSRKIEYALSKPKIELKSMQRGKLYSFHLQRET
jgi:hypothetical protein